MTADDVWYVSRIPTEGGCIVKDTFGTGECDGVAEKFGTCCGSATVVRVDDGAPGVILERDRMLVVTALSKLRVF